MKVIPDRVAARAATNVTIAGDCRLSRYSIGSHGYAQIGWWVDGKVVTTTAYRAAWVHYTGEQIPEGKQVDHTCRNRQCVARVHLRLIDGIDNARRNGAGRDFPLGWLCKANHPASAQVRVTRRTKRGDPRESTTCGECRRDSQRAYIARRKEGA